MELGKLHLELYKFITAEKRIQALEERKLEVSRTRKNLETLDTIVAFPDLVEINLKKWHKLYKEELELELEIVSIKKFQVEFMLERLLTD